MSLFRKPRVGDVLVTKTGQRYVVRRFGEDGDRVCFVEGDRGETCFIWSFADGSLNEWFSHAPELTAPISDAT